jgi:hypothetical protein
VIEGSKIEPPTEQSHQGRQQFRSIGNSTGSSECTPAPIHHGGNRGVGSNDRVFVDQNCQGVSPPRREASRVSAYMAPPKRAVVLCVNEKSQIQALDPTHPLPPMRPGQPERRNHDYRHGTLSLFAALETATGKIVTRHFARHRAREFRASVDTVKANVPEDHDFHIVMDSMSSHKTEAIRNWSARRPRRQGILHPDLGLLDQPGRALLYQPHGKTNPSRRASLDR